MVQALRFVPSFSTAGAQPLGRPKPTAGRSGTVHDSRQGAVHLAFSNLRCSPVKKKKNQGLRPPLPVKGLGAAPGAAHSKCSGNSRRRARERGKRKGTRRRPGPQHARALSRRAGVGDRGVSARGAWAAGPAGGEPERGGGPGDCLSLPSGSRLPPSAGRAGPARRSGRPSPQPRARFWARTCPPGERTPKHRAWKDPTQGPGRAGPG